jgi:ABC-type multidrug transport system fused ATPase/permease subunit
MAISIPICLGVLYLVQRYYLRTSRQIRLLDIEAKSPLYTSFLETTEGVETIRAFGWQQDSKRRYRELLDASQKPFYLLYCIQRWLNLVLDLIVAAFAILAMALATQISGASTGALGVALTNLLTFNASLAYLIQAWTTLETSIGSVARVRSFIKSTPSELSPDLSGEHPPDWTEKGDIIFSNFTASYRYASLSSADHFLLPHCRHILIIMLSSPNMKPILNNVNISINAGEKVAIVGRTGR